jgi:hypothetical protein
MKVIIHKLKLKFNGKIVYAIKHPCELTYKVSTVDGLLEYTENEMKEQYTFINQSEVDLNDILKKAFIGA